MFRRSFRVLAASDYLQGFNDTKNKFFTNLWNKPQTRDERVKEYVPEILEESLEEQRAVLQETNSRDVIVELGHKIMLEIENKSPTPTVAPQLNKLLAQYGVKEVIPQRALSYLLYPNSSALSGGEQPHELVGGFPDHFRTLIEEVERNGCSAVRDDAQTDTPAIAASAETATVDSPRVSEPTAEDGASASKSGPIVMTPKDEEEPLDLTMFVKVVSGMAMANLHCGDVRNAIRCVDAGVAHAKNPERLGGLLGLKAGLLCQSKKYEDAAEAAELAVESSGNLQGYLQGAYALRMLNRPIEAVALLERGREDHPMNTSITAQIEATKKLMERSLPSGSGGATEVRSLSAGKATKVTKEVPS